MLKVVNRACKGGDPKRWWSVLGAVIIANWSWGPEIRAKLNGGSEHAE